MPEIIDLIKIIIGSCKFMQLRTFCKEICVMSWCIQLSLLINEEATAACFRRDSFINGITFVGRFECIGCMACALPKPVSHPPLLS